MFRKRHDPSRQISYRKADQIAREGSQRVLVNVLIRPLLIALVIRFEHLAAADTNPTPRPRRPWWQLGPIGFGARAVKPIPLRGDRRIYPVTISVLIEPVLLVVIRPVRMDSTQP